jgi:hypothetical protein
MSRERSIGFLLTNGLVTFDLFLAAYLGGMSFTRKDEQKLMVINSPQADAALIDPETGRVVAKLGERLQGVAGNYAVVEKNGGRYLVNLLTREEIEFTLNNTDKLEFVYVNNGQAYKGTATFEPYKITVSSLDPQQSFSWTVENMSGISQTMAVGKQGIWIVDTSYVLRFSGEMGQKSWQLPEGTSVVATGPDARTVIVQIDNVNGAQAWSWEDELPDETEGFTKHELMLPEHAGLSFETAFMLNNQEALVVLEDRGEEKTYLQVIDIKARKGINEMLAFEGEFENAAIAGTGRAVALYTFQNGSSIADQYYIEIEEDGSWGEETHSKASYYQTGVGVGDISKEEPADELYFAFGALSLATMLVVMSRFRQS